MLKEPFKKAVLKEPAKRTMLKEPVKRVVLKEPLAMPGTKEMEEVNMEQPATREQPSSREQPATKDQQEEPRGKRSIKLYVRRVVTTNSCKMLIPSKGCSSATSQLSTCRRHQHQELKKDACL